MSVQDLRTLALFDGLGDDQLRVRQATQEEGAPQLVDQHQIVSR